MKNRTVDVAVIGAGSAGMTAYRAARLLKEHVVLIEGGPYGTTCARVGCMPSKLLIAAAEAAHGVRHASVFGVGASDLTIDGKAVMERVQTERDRFVDYVVRSVEALPAEDRLQGHARFVAPNRLQVGDDVLLDAGSIVIATGSHPVIPDILRPLGTRLLTSNELFDWKTLPASIAVIGTGAIGLELGQALHRLGVRVTMFGRDGGLGQLRDPMVLERAFSCFSAELDLRLHTEIIGAQVRQDQAWLSSRSRSGIEKTDAFDCVLVAAGRSPNLQALALENAGLALDSRGIPTFDPVTMQCGGAVFIAGDAGSERPVLHEATSQGRIAGENAGNYPEVRPGNRHVPLGIVFTDPQLASTGFTVQALRGKRFAIGEVSFENQGRSRVMDQNRGLLRLYGEFDSGIFLGAEMVGPRAEHLIHLLAWAAERKMTVQDMMAMPFYHPVVEEGIRTGLKDLRENLLHGLPEIERCTDCTPGV